MGRKMTLDTISRPMESLSSFTNIHEVTLPSPESAQRPDRLGTTELAESPVCGSGYWFWPVRSQSAVVLHKPKGGGVLTSS